MSKALTEDEIADRLLRYIASFVDHWSEADGTVREKMNGLVHSVLAILDGQSLDLPAFDLHPMPHENDKEYQIANGFDWVEPGTCVSVALHERWHVIESESNNKTVEAENEQLKSQISGMREKNRAAIDWLDAIKEALLEEDHQ